MIINTRAFLEVTGNGVYIVLPFKKDEGYDLRKLQVTNPSEVSQSLHKTKVFVEMEIISTGIVKIISINDFDRQKGSVSFNQNDKQFYPICLSKETDKGEITSKGGFRLYKGNLEVIAIID